MSRFRVKTPHFDGLVRAPLTGLRIGIALIYVQKALLVQSLKIQKIWNRIYFGLVASFLVEPLRFLKGSPRCPLEIFNALESPGKPT